MAANKYIRWNLLFLFLILVIISIPFWLPAIPVVNVYTKEIVLSIITCFHLFWFCSVTCAIRRCVAIRMRKDHNRLFCPIGSRVRVKHIIAMCMYKEPIQVLKASLDSLALQWDADERLCIIIGLEEGTPEKGAKIDEILAKYTKKFHRLIITIHPANQPGEIAGKCSNMNFAARTGISKLKEDRGYDFNGYHQIFTNCDCDSIFDPDYTVALEQSYLSMTDIEERQTTIWQAAIAYENLSMPGFVRTTGVLRTFAFMGITIPWNINPMSLYSLSVELLEMGDYLHPEYQMEDIIALIRYTLVAKRRIKLKPLNVVCLNGPTSGEHFRGECYEWSRQIRRWAIGAAEVFHYFLAKVSNMPSVTLALTWGFSFFMYYGIILCAAPIFSISGPALSIAMMGVYGVDDSSQLITDEIFFLIMISLFVLQYFWFLLVFTFCGFLLVPKYPTRFHDNKHHWSPWRILYYLLTFTVLISHSCIQLFAFFEIAIRGKAVCKHGAAKKNNLTIQRTSTISYL